MALHTVSSERKNIPSTKSVKYIAMADVGNWDLITSLSGGRRTMIAQGEKYNPKQEAEKDRPYNARLNRSFLFEGFNDTIDKLSAKPFARAITVQGELNEKLKDIENDVDGTGKSLTQLGRELMGTGLRRGLTHVFIDFTSKQFTDEDGNLRPATIAEEESIGARPIITEIGPTNFIDWFENDQGKLVYARWIENSVERVSQYVDETRSRIREMNETEWFLYELQEDKEDTSEEEKWVVIEQGTHTFGEVPIVTFYTEQTGSRTARPPLRKLAEANLEHWQSKSDQKNLLNVARAGILLLTGFTDEDIEDGVTIGPRSQLTSTSPDANAKWVEHTGNAIEAGRQDLIDIENYMTILGTEPLVIRPGNRTATADVVDDSKGQSAVQTWIRLLESTLKDVYINAARWLKVEDTLPDDFAIDIFNEFGITLAGKKEIDVLLKMRNDRQITQETFLKEMKRRGVLSESVDIMVEVETTEEEAMDLSNNIFGNDDLTGGLNDDDPNEE